MCISSQIALIYSLCLMGLNVWSKLVKWLKYTWFKTTVSLRTAIRHDRAVMLDLCNAVFCCFYTLPFFKTSNLKENCEQIIWIWRTVSNVAIRFRKKKPASSHASQACLCQFRWMWLYVRCSPAQWPHLIELGITPHTGEEVEIASESQSLFTPGQLK